MNTNLPSSSVGYLIVKVSTAQGAIPLSGASVSIRGETSDSDILYSLTTNADGQTERVSLPTPSKASSESPGNIRPYATYSIDVFKDGYLPLYFQNVPVFASVLSIQPAVMIPAPEGVADYRFPPSANHSPIQEEPYGNL